MSMFDLVCVTHRGLCAGDLPQRVGELCRGGIHRVIQALGAAQEDCYAIGDSTNDLPMLQAVPHSIAMGHAPEQVKAAASYITDEIGRDGLARALAHFGLC